MNPLVRITQFTKSKVHHRRVWMPHNALFSPVEQRYTWMPSQPVVPRSEEVRSKLDNLTTEQLHWNKLGQPHLFLLGGIKQTLQGRLSNSCCTFQPVQLAMVPISWENQGIEARACNTCSLTQHDLQFLGYFLLKRLVSTFCLALQISCLQGMPQVVFQWVGLTTLCQGHCEAWRDICADTC